MQITLRQFELIETLHDRLMRDPFETTVDPREWIKTSNRLFDACADAIGFPAANDFASAMDCAAAILCTALISESAVLDEEAA
ncbi:MAG: hypothetical protein RL268_176 [Pseudomonadota bacterium]|jgi:hypothetical protein